MTPVAWAHDGKVSVSTEGGGSPPIGYVFTRAASIERPTVTEVFANSGPQTGGNNVTITGTGLTGATRVSFGGMDATSFVVDSSGTALTAVAPGQTPGTIDVTVTNAAGTSPVTAADRYRYTDATQILEPTVSSITPTSGSNWGGETVQLIGSGFTGATAVMFTSGFSRCSYSCFPNFEEAASFTVTSDSQITAVTPVAWAHDGKVSVSTEGGGSPPIEYVFTEGPSCGGFTGSLLHNRKSAHFYIEYSRIRGGLTIRDYVAALEKSWTTQITAFGWKAPPLNSKISPPGGRYHVRVDDRLKDLGSTSSRGTFAGRVGNNPNTSWNEGDAYASCIVLRSDYSVYPAPAYDLLKDTAAHEFNHALQLGYGALTGVNAPDPVFVEGGATWMSDEVFPGSASVNLRVFRAPFGFGRAWPEFEDDMGAHEVPENSFEKYRYWITWRGLTEQFGTGVAGGGEDIMQDFWEITSRNEASNLEAMDRALRNHGTTLADAYHAYAIAVKFNAPCGGEFTYPYCFRHGPEWEEIADTTPLSGTIASVGGSFNGHIEDNYALNWIEVPSRVGSYKVSLRNTDTGGAIRGTVVCDAGSAFRMQPFSRVVRGGQSTIQRFDTRGCNRVVVVLTNQLRTGPNPSSSEARTYTLKTAAI